LEVTIARDSYSALLTQLSQSRKSLVASESRIVQHQLRLADLRHVESTLSDRLVRLTASIPNLSSELTTASASEEHAERGFQELSKKLTGLKESARCDIQTAALVELTGRVKAINDKRAERDSRRARSSSIAVSASEFDETIRTQQAVRQIRAEIDARTAAAIQQRHAELDAQLVGLGQDRSAASTHLSKCRQSLAAAQNELAGLPKRIEEARTEASRVANLLETEQHEAEQIRGLCSSQQEAFDLAKKELSEVLAKYPGAGTPTPNTFL
jgi:chromosome segregation ATPase